MPLITSGSRVQFFILFANLSVPLTTQKVFGGFASNLHERCVSEEGTL